MSQEHSSGGVSLAHLPLPLFAATMGLSGLALVWQRVALQWGWGSGVGEALTLLAAAVFVATAGGYAVKVVRHFDHAAADVRHPVRINFLPAISISLILLGMLAEPGRLSIALWGGGALLHLLLTLLIVSSWLHRQLDSTTLNPVWFIPAVGNILIPIPAAAAGYTEIAWFFFTVGLFFWLILMTLCYYRLIFGPNLPDFLMPTLTVLLAPPAVGLLAWLALNDGGDPGVVGRLLYYKALFTFLLLLFQLPRLLRVAFYPSWWAYTFPLAAFVMASFHYVDAYLPAAEPLLIGLVGLVTAVIAVVLVTTLVHLANGKLLRPE